MRLCRIVAVLGLLAALSLPAAASAAESKHHVGLHDMTCTSITAMGKGLPASTSVQLTLTNRDTGGTLAGQTVRTSAKGDFMCGSVTYHGGETFPMVAQKRPSTYQSQPQAQRTR